MLARRGFVTCPSPHRIAMSGVRDSSRTPCIQTPCIVAYPWHLLSEVAPRISVEDCLTLKVNAVRLSESSVTVTKLHGVTSQKLQNLTASVVAASDLVFNWYTAVTELTAFPQRFRSAHNITALLLDGKFYGRRRVGRPRMRWEDNNRRGSSLLLNRRERRRLAGDMRFWNWIIEEDRACCGLSRPWRRARGIFGFVT